MIIIRNKRFPSADFIAFAIGPLVFARHTTKLSATTLRHEAIHWAQEKELLLVGNYLLYSLEYLARIAAVLYRKRTLKLTKQIRRTAYRNISFEREAYDNESNPNYLQARKLYAWTKYLKRKRPQE